MKKKTIFFKGGGRWRGWGEGLEGGLVEEGVAMKLLNTFLPRQSYQCYLPVP